MADTYMISGNVSDFALHSESRDAVRFNHLDITTEDGIVELRKPIVSKSVVTDVVSGETGTFHVAKILGWNHIYRFSTSEFIIDGSKPYRAAKISYAILSALFAVIVVSLLNVGFGVATIPLIGMSVLCGWMSSKYPR